MTAPPNIEEAERFLNALDPSATTFTFQTFDDKPKRKDGRLVRVLNGTLAEHAAELARLNARGAGVYVTINETDGQGRKTANITRVRFQYVDLDGAPLEPVLANGLQPHIVVNTSPGRWHCYWCVDGMPLERFSGVQMALIARYGSDPAVKDLSRCMRLPGFMHRKGAPHMVLVQSINTAPPYAVEAFPYQGQQRNAPRAPIVLPDWLTAVLARDAWLCPAPDAPPDRSEIAFALSVTPADSELVWFEVGCALANTLGDDGWAVFDDWSSTCPDKYDAAECAAKWEHCKTITSYKVGTLFHHATEADPQWRARWRAQQPDEPPPAEEAPPPSDAPPPPPDDGLAGTSPPPEATPQPDAAPAPPPQLVLLQTSARFVAGFTPPDYLIDGFLQRRFIYSLTAPTGWGKTAVTLRICAHVALGMPIAGRDVEQGNVLFLAGENPDDIRTRWIKQCEELGKSPDEMPVIFLPGTTNIFDPKIRRMINADAAALGGFSLMVIDTSAAFFKGDNENDNNQMGTHARLMRDFVTLPGGPTVVPTCHAVKNYDPSNLLPRGGGAFLAEVDGNLVALKEGSVVTIDTHGKFRGPEFAQFSFKLKPGTSEQLKDTKGRKIWTVTAEPISEAARSSMEDVGRRRMYDVLRAVCANPGRSIKELATLLGWMTLNNEPNRTAVYRHLQTLKTGKLVKMAGDRYEATPAGVRALAAEDNAPL